MTDMDWELIRKVHIDGAYKVTKAAWPHMLAQGYGRVIFVSSAAGIYGNFGQANYSAAKLALYGLGRTLAKEGGKKNIFCNIVAPLAFTRLTASIANDEQKMMGPETIAPFVANLCHESCKDNGGMFEVGGGFAAKGRWQRAQGAFLKITDNEIPPGIVAVKFHEICDFGQKNEYSDVINDVNWVEKAQIAMSLPANPKGPNLRFENRVVIVTGAGGGLGRSYAIYFAKYGAKVLVNDFNKAAADAVVQEIAKTGGQALANYNSVTDAEAVIKQVVDAWGRVDVLVNNAGILRDKSFAKMTDQEWSVVLQVHLDGTFKMTKAAWPFMIKQKYGRVINTSSAVGLYGNFGQANYSAAKAGIIAFSNAVAREGFKHNIFLSTIAPNAGTAMTAGLYTPEMIAMFKPDYIAPLVAYLSHESFKQSGGVYEVGSGWMAQVRWERSAGMGLDLANLTIEEVHKAWPAITDFSRGVTYPTNSVESFQQMNENVKRKSSGTDSGSEVKARDIQLYNLGIGCSEKELKYVYENAPDFAAFPTFGVTLSFGQVMDADLGKYVNGYSLLMLLHGEQYLEIVNPIPLAGRLSSTSEVLEVTQKGKAGSTVVVQLETKDDKGRTICINESTLFLRGTTVKTGFSGAPQKRRELSSLAVSIPDRAPDAVVKQKIPENQAAIYRLSGDLNPLHIDPDFATKARFKKPILHGLCSYGVASRHVIATFADNDPKRMKCVKARFTKHVFPGEEVQTEMWKVNSTRVIFQLRVVGRDEIAIGNAFVEFHPALSSAEPSQIIAITGAGGIAAEVVKKLAANLTKLSDSTRQDLVKKTKGVFQFEVASRPFFVDMKNGKGAIGAGPSPAAADLTVAIAKEQDFADLASGKLGAQAAYMKGLIKIKGNMMLGMKMDGILKTLSGTPSSKL